MEKLPDNFISLHAAEEGLRSEAVAHVLNDPAVSLHLELVERAMDLSNLLRMYPSEDEDFKVIQLFGVRIFNAFASGLKLCFAGYNQNSALILRDVLETVFLLDLFKSNRALISEWRFADKKRIREKFSPAAVRKALDQRDGNTGGKREEAYKMFSELAGHPTMKSAFMLRPDKDGDALIGPFIEDRTVAATLGEMGRLAFQVGQHLYPFFPKDWIEAQGPRAHFIVVATKWSDRFYPTPRGSR